MTHKEKDQFEKAEEKYQEDLAFGHPLSDEQICEPEDLPVEYELVKSDHTHIMSWGVNESYGEMKLTKKEADIIKFVADCKKEADFKTIYKINDTVFKLSEIVSL